MYKNNESYLRADNSCTDSFFFTQFESVFVGICTFWQLLCSTFPSENHVARHPFPLQILQWRSWPNSSKRQQRSWPNLPYQCLYSYKNIRILWKTFVLFAWNLLSNNLILLYLWPSQLFTSALVFKRPTVT